MSKRGYISRYVLIIKKLKQKPYATLKELQSYLDNQSQYLQLQDESLNLGISERTLQRDFKEVRNLFGLDIEYSKKHKGYFINQSIALNDAFQQLLDAFDMFNALGIAQDLSPFVHAQKRRAQGTENLYGLMHAIKNKFIIHLYL